MIDEATLAKVRSQVDDALAKGARLVTGGKRWSANTRGAFYEPTVWTGVNESSTICREETFRPVAPIIPFADEAEALRMAKTCRTGLPPLRLRAIGAGRSAY